MNLQKARIICRHLLFNPITEVSAVVIGFAIVVSILFAILYYINEYNKYLISVGILCQLGTTKSDNDLAIGWTIIESVAFTMFCMLLGSIVQGIILTKRAISIDLAKLNVPAISAQ